jgi:hypothetical protein
MVNMNSRPQTTDSRQQSTDDRQQATLSKSKLNGGTGSKVQSQTNILVELVEQKTVDGRQNNTKTRK